jgi:hypothetical protein
MSGPVASYTTEATVICMAPLLIGEMKHDILTKLQTELLTAIESEPQVVYIMVEIRKLMELDEKKETYPSLTFHCDWILHTKLTGRSAQQIVRAFDKQQEYFEKTSALRTGESTAFDMSFMRILGPTVTMSNFRNELDQFLRAHRLSTTLVDSEASWANFLRHYGAIVQECPLKCISQGLKHVEEVTLKVTDLAADTTAKTGFTLAINWTWTLKTTGQILSNRQMY